MVRIAHDVEGRYRVGYDVVVVSRHSEFFKVDILAEESRKIGNPSSGIHVGKNINPYRYMPLVPGPYFSRTIFPAHGVLPYPDISKLRRQLHPRR